MLINTGIYTLELSDTLPPRPIKVLEMYPQLKAIEFEVLQNQYSDIQVFEHPYEEYGVQIDFQGCHLFGNSQISTVMATLKMKLH